MTYFSVCSGIEAASVAWEPLGWQAIGFSEIEPFPCEVLRQRFPKVKNYGDMTKFREWDNVGQFGVLVGGTPCQSFSVAGKRGGTNDVRGRLMYSYLGIVEKYKPRWILWENVPGVLSSGKGLDFASFLGGLEQCGYGWAYRVLDAQFFGVPQRRRRVFVVGHIDNRCDLAAKVLFEPESMCSNFKTSSKMQQNTSAEAGSGIKSILYLTHPQKGDYTESNGIAGTVTAAYGEGGGHVPLVLNTYTDSSFGAYREGCGTLKASGGALGGGSETLVREGSTLRRLTPVECERLQGFPDNWTRIEWRGKAKEQCPDSLRYKAIGNSMAVPVMRWIGDRIKRIEGESR